MDSRTAQVERLHAQISQDGYEIDPQAVADAIVRRLLAMPKQGSTVADDSKA
jgi:anti-sigma28 factor (negative regulator of flagellin synthesis)